MQIPRTVLWVIFVMSLYFLFVNWQQANAPKPPPNAAAPQSQTSNPAGSTSGSAADASVPPPPTEGGAVPPVPANTAGQPLPAQPSAADKGRTITLANDVIKVDIDSVGGTIRRVELLKHLADDGAPGNLVLLDNQPGKVYIAQSGLIGVKDAPTHLTPMQVVKEVGQASVQQEDPKKPKDQKDLDAKPETVHGSPAELVLASANPQLRLERRYVLEPGSYEIKVSNTVSNTGSEAISPIVYEQLTRDEHKPGGQNSMYSSYLGPVAYSEEAKFHKAPFDKVASNKAEFPVDAKDGWIGMIQHYFAAVWIPKEGTARRNFMRKSGEGLYSVGAMQTLQVPPGQSATQEASLFVGPQNQRLLEKTAPGLELVRDYGWLTILAKPLFWLLVTLHNIVQNWGWAIVLLTILIKLLFFPLQAASYRSMAKMRKVTPKLQSIRERYGDDRVRQQQAMMELYKTEKINPLGGCLPVVVQIPVFIALYWVLLASVEMRNAPWMLWIKDLATPDPYFVLPILMAGTMFLQTRLNPTPPDPMQAKIMMWMPLAFSVMFFFFPAGLVLYWLVSNIFSIAQQWVITRHIEGKPVFGRASS